MPTETDVANRALGKIQGIGDQESATGIIADINSSDRTPAWCKFLLPQVRRRVLGHLAMADTPPKEARIFTDLGAETTTTLKMGGWDYVFNVPKDTIKVIRQIDEVYSTIKSNIADKITEYAFQIRWKGTDMLLFTNNLSNTDSDSAFIERVFDQDNPGTWSEELIDCIATLLGAELVPALGAVNEKRVTLLAEYKTVSLPTVKAFIQSQDNDFKRITKPNYKGGRSESLPTV